MNRARMGRLEVITGCMFSGKTEELIRRLERVRIAKGRICLFKPTVDDRYSGQAQEGISRRARVAWRGNKIAMAWESSSAWPGGNGPRLLTGRVFEYGEASVDDYMLH